MRECPPYRNIGDSIGIQKLSSHILVPGSDLYMMTTPLHHPYKILEEMDVSWMAHIDQYPQVPTPPEGNERIKAPSTFDCLAYRSAWQREKTAFQ